MISVKNTLRLATCLTVMGVASPAYASNVFLLQLGLFSSKEAADEQFKKIMDTHGKVLDNKRYISKQGSSISGGESAWRVLVGPYENRKLASRACSKLKTTGEDCFVVETAAINMDDVESGTALKAKEEAPADTLEVSTSSESSEAVESVSTKEPSSDSSWDWFSRSDAKEADGETVDVEAEVKSEVEVAPSASDDSGRININTRSVYANQNAAPKDSGGDDLIKSISSLFDSGSSDDATAENESEKAPDEGNSVESEAEKPEIAETSQEAKSSANEPEKAPEIATKKRTGEVEIAEAIPVPLTEEKDVPITKSAPIDGEKSLDESVTKSGWFSREEKSANAMVNEPTPPTPPSENPSAPIRSAPKQIPLAEYQQATSSTRMLQISVFDNDRLAFQCLSMLQKQLPASVMLRSRIIKSTGGQAVLRLGPVNDPDLESEVCNVSAQCGEALQCSTVTEHESRKSRRIAPLKPLNKTQERHGFKMPESNNSYVSDAPMPRNLSPREATPMSNAISPSSVWVQLGTSNSESDARSKFETLKSLHPDVLGDFAPVINTPENQLFGKTVYRLRIGSFEDRSKAQSICAKLSSRGVGCLVLSK
jgi:hypothetical protein